MAHRTQRSSRCHCLDARTRGPHRALRYLVKGRQRSHLRRTTDAGFCSPSTERSPKWRTTSPSSRSPTASAGASGPLRWSSFRSPTRCRAPTPSPFTPRSALWCTRATQTRLTPIDGRRTDINRLAALGDEGVALLMADSTNAEEPGFTPSERTWAWRFAVSSSNGPLDEWSVACFASHIHRIQQIAERRP